MIEVRRDDQGVDEILISECGNIYIHIERMDDDEFHLVVESARERRDFCISATTHGNSCLLEVTEQ